MILIDTSVWVDFLRISDESVAELLETNEVLTHPFVIGELALGNLQKRRTVLALLESLPKVIPALDDEVRDYIERHALAGAGIGYVDAHLLVSTQLTPGTKFWTRDKRLLAVAERLGVADGRNRKPPLA